MGGNRTGDWNAGNPWMNAERARLQTKEPPAYQQRPGDREEPKYCPHERGAEGSYNFMTFSA